MIFSASAQNVTAVYLPLERDGDDETPNSGVREPRKPKPSTSSGGVRLAEPEDNLSDLCMIGAPAS